MSLVQELISRGRRAAGSGEGDGSESGWCHGTVYGTSRPAAPTELLEKPPDVLHLHATLYSSSIHFVWYFYLNACTYIYTHVHAYVGCFRRNSHGSHDSSINMHENSGFLISIFRPTNLFPPRLHLRWRAWAPTSFPTVMVLIENIRLSPIFVGIIIITIEKSYIFCLKEE